MKYPLQMAILSDGVEIGPRKTFWLHIDDLLVSEYSASLKGRELCRDAISHFGLWEEFKRQKIKAKILSDLRAAREK